MMGSLFGKKSHVGIDIGHQAIKFVFGEKNGGLWKLSHFVSVPTPADSVKDGVVIDSEAIGLTIKSVLKEHKINASSCALAVSGASVIVRSVRVPKMNEVTFRKSIRYEASRYIQASVDDSYIDCEIVAQHPDGQMEVQIVAAPKQLVSSRVRAAEFADLTVDSVDVETFAAHRALIESDESNALNQMTVALIDIGFSSTTVSVVSHGVFTMSRTIAHGGQTWSEALKTYFKLSDQDAENGKAQLDLTPLLAEAQMDNPPLRVLQPHVDDLVREVRRSLNYYQSQQTEGGPKDPITHMVLTGGASRLGGIATYFSNKLGIPAICRGVFDNPLVVGRSTDGSQNGLEFAVAAGLAMIQQGKAA